jgi:hypothetical protein
MTVLSVLSYREITGDSETASAEVERVIGDAQALLEDELIRPLDLKTRTEQMRLIREDRTGIGMCFPKVTPLISEANGLLCQGGIIWGTTPDSTPIFDWIGAPPLVATLTYTGGFDVDETDSEAATYVPPYIRYDLAWAAWQLLQPLTGTPSGFPTGAIQVHSGDQSVTFKDPVSAASDRRISWSCNTLAWKRRRP